MEPWSTDTRLIRTVSFSPTKAHKFSLELTGLLRTPVNTDNGYFSVFRATNSPVFSTPLYGHWLSALCLFSLCANCKHCTLFKEWISAGKYDFISLFSPSSVRCLTLLLWPLYKIFCLPLNRFHFLGFFLQSLFAPLYLYIDKKNVSVTLFLRARLIHTPDFLNLRDVCYNLRGKCSNLAQSSL